MTPEEVAAARARLEQMPPPAEPAPPFSGELKRGVAAIQRLVEWMADEEECDYNDDLHDAHQLLLVALGRFDAYKRSRVSVATIAHTKQADA